LPGVAGVLSADRRNVAQGLQRTRAQVGEMADRGRDHKQGAGNRGQGHQGFDSLGFAPGR
jgi:ribosomal protein L15